mgnify:CR=1 FL=1
MTPKISVVMPVYNTKKEYLREAIDSILRQSFTDFEFIIVDDCSDEETKRVLAAYSDSRINVYHNEKNLGVAGSLNRALEMSKGKYIARMDSDDVAVDARLAMQWEYMEKHPEVIALGGVAKVIGKKEFRGCFSKKKRSELQLELIFNNINLVHPTVMFRGTVIRENGLFYDEAMVAEDYELWTRCIQYGDIVSIPQILLYYRVHEQQVTSSKRELIIQGTNEVRSRQLKNMGMELNEQEKKIFNELREYRCLESEKNLDLFLNKLEKFLKGKGYPQAGSLLWHYWVCIMREYGIGKMLKYRRTYQVMRPTCFFYNFRHYWFEKIWIQMIVRKIYM